MRRVLVMSSSGLASSTGPEPGRSQAPYWVTTVAEARKDVDEDAAKKVDIIKIWVDDRDHTVTKLTPELYGAAIEEAQEVGGLPRGDGAGVSNSNQAQRRCGSKP